MVYAEIWFIVTILLFTGYVILDGFDLGVGILHLFSRTDEERRINLNAIGPVWDGNEVWLVTAGGAIFAGFPEFYASLCSAFYMPVMVLLTGLIFRAVAIEFRSKEPWGWWRQTWDVLFSLSSFVVTFSLGLVIGHLVQGVPYTTERGFYLPLAGIFQPYPLLIAVLSCVLFAVHAAMYLLMKTEGDYHDTIRSWLHPLMIGFIVLSITATMATLTYQSHMAEVLRKRPYFFLLALGNMLAIANIPREVTRGRDALGFLSSCLSMAFFMALYGVGLYPKLMHSLGDGGAASLTVSNAASSELTLQILLLIACIGMPLVLAYTISIYSVFSGKVKLGEGSL